jgi:hypothetical protein
MSDIDFLAEASSWSGDDALAPAAANPATDLRCADTDSGVDFLAEASSDEDPAPQPPPARRRRRAQPKPKAVSVYGKPGERTALQHAALTSKMREARACSRYRSACTAQAASVAGQVNDIVSRGVPTRAALSLQVPRWLSTSHRRKNVGNLKVVASESAHLAPTIKLAIAYSGVHCTQSLATMFQCDPRAIEYNQRLVAVAFLDLQAVMVERVAQAIAETTTRSRQLSPVRLGSEYQSLMSGPAWFPNRLGLVRSQDGGYRGSSKVLVKSGAGQENQFGPVCFLQMSTSASRAQFDSDVTVRSGYAFPRSLSL